MMEYIQCTHCGKRYEVSDQIRAAAGQFTTCQACEEKFLIVVHSGDKAGVESEADDGVISTDGWDPSLTMPDESGEDTNEDVVHEAYFDDDADDAAEVLATLQAARKKKNVLYASVGLIVVLLLGGGWFVLQEGSMSDDVMQAEQSAASKPVVQTAKQQDINHAACRHEAAQQWLLDYKAMHSIYSSEEFVRLLKSSEQQTAKVHEFCKSNTLIKEIMIAATNKEKIDWFEAEIEVIQSNRQR